MSTNSPRNILIASYLILLGVGIYFGWNLAEFRPRYWLLLGLAVQGLALGAAIGMAAKKAAQGPKRPAWAPMVLHAILQGAVGFALAYHLFKLPWMSALAFPVGALSGLATWWAAGFGRGVLWSSLVSALFLAGPFAVSLRLEGIQGAFLFGLGLMNAAFLGAQLLAPAGDRLEIWVRAMVFGAFMVLGRAAIQYFLLTSGYASLGVVVTHPYTFVALFLGLFLPLAYPYLLRENLLPPAVIWIVLGLILPLSLGIFIHVRPMAAYLMGLVVSGFAVGLVQRPPVSLALFGYLGMLAVCAGYPLFKATVNLSRVIRLEILGGLLLASVIGYLLLARDSRGSSETAS